MLVATQSEAIRELRSMFGAGGYRAYAEALGRASTTFHASVSKTDSTTGLLVVFGCRLLAVASSFNECPDTILQRSATFSFPSIDHRTGLEFAMFCLLGEDHIVQLSEAIGVSISTVKKALQNENARYAPHFRLYATCLVAIQKRGGSTREAVHKVSAMQGRGVAVANG